MVQNMKYAAALVFGAALVSAQNSTTTGGATIAPDATATTSSGGAIIAPDATATSGGAVIGPGATAITTAGGIVIDIDINFIYTTMIPSLCPTGFVNTPYTIHQFCPRGPCTQPAVPYGWQVTSRMCNSGCGAGPTMVPVTECPWATPAPVVPACSGPSCYHDEIVCPKPNGPGMTTFTHYYPGPTPVPMPTPVPVVPNGCKGYDCPPQTLTPVVPTTPDCYGPSCPSKPVVPTTPDCYGPSCPSKPVVPCVGAYCPPTNQTTPVPPVYQGAATKTAVSGVFGFMVAAIAALL